MCGEQGDTLVLPQSPSLSCRRGTQPPFFQRGPFFWTEAHDNRPTRPHLGHFANIRQNWEGKAHTWPTCSDLSLCQYPSNLQSTTGRTYCHSCQSCRISNNSICQDVSTAKEPGGVPRRLGGLLAARISPTQPRREVAGNRRAAPRRPAEMSPPQPRAIGAGTHREKGG